MFGFLKSDSSIENDVRDWAFREAMRYMRSSEEPNMRRFHAEQDIVRLVQAAAVACVRWEKEAERNFHLIGERPDPAVARHYMDGSRLIRRLADKRGWRLRIDGSLSTGFKCHVEKG